MHRVDWIQSALDRLVEIWLAADSRLRQAITRASHRVEVELGRQPAHKGVLCSDRQRAILIPPLCFLYEVDGQHSVVTILQVEPFHGNGQQ